MLLLCLNRQAAQIILKYGIGCVSVDKLNRLAVSELNLLRQGVVSERFWLQLDQATFGLFGQSAMTTFHPS